MLLTSLSETKRNVFVQPLYQMLRFSEDISFYVFVITVDQNAFYQRYLPNLTILSIYIFNNLD